MRERELIHFADVTFDQWIENMIKDQLQSVDVGNCDHEELVSLIYDNVVFLLEYEYNGQKIGDQIYNQDFVDTIRNIMAYTIHGNFDTPILSAEYFNNLASTILPKILEHFRTNNFKLRELLMVSIASGLSGLDLKGSPAASSKYSNFGIPMAHYAKMDKNEAVSEYIEELEKIVKTSDTSFFHWDTLVSKLCSSRKISWMTDDYIESHFDLLIIERILDEYDVVIEIIPKNGFYGNDLSWQDLETILGKGLYPKLSEYLKDGRFIINKYGPMMGAANIVKLSDESVLSILDSSFVVAKGCRIHELTQGNINSDMFYSYIICRELSESSTGLSAVSKPIVFHYVPKGMYTFWGIEKIYAKSKIFKGEERGIDTYYSTLDDYERRANMTNVQEILKETKELIDFYQIYSGNKRPLISTLRLLNHRLQECLMK